MTRPRGVGSDRHPGLLRAQGLALPCLTVGGDAVITSRAAAGPGLSVICVVLDALAGGAAGLPIAL